MARGKLDAPGRLNTLSPPALSPIPVPTRHPSPPAHLTHPISRPSLSPVGDEHFPVLIPTKSFADVVLFDGTCNLCHGAIQFVLRRDPGARFRFASLQSAAGRRVLAEVGTPAALPDSLILVRGGRVHWKSGAALRIAQRLGWPWPLCAVLLAVPAPLRDLVYDYVAANRQRWFGTRSSCLVPTPALRARFLDADER